MADVAAAVTPIVALDVADTAAAMKIVETLGDLCRYYKIGSELFTAEGPPVVRAVQTTGASLFLDLKFLDIPNTVGGAVRSAASLGVQILTVHASGGRAMLDAAVQAAGMTGSGCQVFAVTVLTSLDADALSAVWDRPVADMQAEVLRLAGHAREAGAHGIVCSGREAAAVRERFIGSLATLVPGVRLQGGALDDQSRVVTPREAAAAGARYIVLGRAVTGAPSPATAMKAVLADLP